MLRSDKDHSKYGFSLMPEEDDDDDENDEDNKSEMSVIVIFGNRATVMERS